MGQGHYKIHLRKHIQKGKTSHGKTARMLDGIMYIVALIAPIMTIPQLVQVWASKQAQGVSLLTWGAYAIVSGLWMIHGITHKDKPFILTQFLLLVLDSLIVVGVLLHK